MPRRKSIEREVILQYWHITECNTERQLKLIEALSNECNFNDVFVISNVVDEKKLVCSQLS